MKKILLFALLLSFVFSVGVANAKTVTLSWDASPSQGVIGYKIYYSKTNQHPFEGTEATDPAPIDVGNVLTYIVEGLPDEEGFYFGVTAYNGLDEESVYSNVVFSPGFAIPEPPTGLGGKTTIRNIDIPIAGE